MSFIGEIVAEMIGEMVGDAFVGTVESRGRSSLPGRSFFHRLFTPSYSDAYCKSFFCMQCPGMAKGKRTSWGGTCIVARIVGAGGEF
jgi:hypothetical protein